MLESLGSAAIKVVKRPRALMAAMAAPPVWATLFYSWLGIPLEGALALAGLAAGGLALAAAVCFFAYRSAVVFQTEKGSVRGLASAGEFYLVLALFVLFGLAMPWQLIHWVPELASFGGRTASAVARFACAALLFGFCWMWLWAVIRAAMERSAGQRVEPVVEEAAGGTEA